MKNNIVSIDAVISRIEINGYIDCTEFGGYMEDYEYDNIIYYLKKYKEVIEVIDKLKNKTKENIESAKCEITTLTIGDKAYYQYIEKILDNYVDILKEVSE